MPSFSKNEVILVRYPFSDLTATKIRPAVIAGAFGHSPDVLKRHFVWISGRLHRARKLASILLSW
jgi:hypothetical protein